MNEFGKYVSSYVNSILRIPIIKVLAFKLILYFKFWFLSFILMKICRLIYHKTDYNIVLEYVYAIFFFVSNHLRIESISINSNS